MDTLLQDIRYGLRQLRKNPGFTAIAVMTLALGVAVNASMFSLVSAFLLQRAPGVDPGRVVVVSSIDPNQNFLPDTAPVSVPNYLAWRETNHVFSDMAAADEYRTVNLAAQGHPEAVPSAAVSTNYFGVLGVSPQLGRGFLDAEDQPGRDHVVILSHDLWQSHFNSDPTILNRSMRINREDFKVIGVMPSDFRLLGFAPQLWAPLTLSAADRSLAARKDRDLRLFARLKPGVSLLDARAEFATLALHAERDFPETEKGRGVAVRTLSDFLVHNFNIRSGLLVLMTAVGFVLLIACANVAGLLLARAVGRQKEIGLRMSLGAGRSRIIRQLLAEGLLIALAGGAAGLLLASWGINFLRSHLTFNEAIKAVPLSLNGDVLLFILGVSLLSALLSGLMPAFRASRADLNSALKDESRGASAGRSHSRLRTVLVTGEIAMALFLLIGAGLLIRGVFLLDHQKLGFQTDHLLTAGVVLDQARYAGPPQQTLFVRDLISRLAQLPAVDSVAATSDLPATGAPSVTLRIKDQPETSSGERRTALRFVVTTDYFRTAGIPLLRGRTFTETDNTAAPRVALVNQEFVRRHSQEQEVLGKQILLEVNGVAPEWREIVGVVANVKSYSEDAREEPVVFDPFLQHPVSSFSLMMRTSSDPDGLASALRNTVSQLDPELPLAQLLSMSSVIELQRGGNPLFTRVLAGFAILALTLAAIGIYGLIAYSVGLRTREIGVRMALGARRPDVLRMIVWEGIKTAALGAAIGLAVALLLPKAFSAMFNDINFREPALYFLVPLTILLVTILATYIPARRAAKIDPMVALRFE